MSDYECDVCEDTLDECKCVRCEHGRVVRAIHPVLVQGCWSCRQEELADEGDRRRKHFQEEGF